MSRRSLRPPGGSPPPESGRAPGGETAELRPLAEEVCRRYRTEFPDEADRYGDAGTAWCVHDNLHILNWALLDARGLLDLGERIEWLAGVLAARDFPPKRLARDLEIAAEVVEASLGGASAPAVAEALRAQAAAVERHPPPPKR